MFVNERKLKENLEITVSANISQTLPSISVEINLINLASFSLHNIFNCRCLS